MVHTGSCILFNLDQKYTACVHSLFALRLKQTRSDNSTHLNVQSDHCPLIDTPKFARFRLVRLIGSTKGWHSKTHSFRAGGLFPHPLPFVAFSLFLGIYVDRQLRRLRVSLLLLFRDENSKQHDYKIDHSIEFSQSTIYWVGELHNSIAAWLNIHPHTWFKIRWKRHIPQLHKLAYARFHSTEILLKYGWVKSGKYHNELQYELLIYSCTEGLFWLLKHISLFISATVLLLSCLHGMYVYGMRN